MPNSITCFIVFINHNVDSFCSSTLNKLVLYTARVAALNRNIFGLIPYAFYITSITQSR
ncbi:hypothetical protein HanIR_Chr05g0254981 [Helianthus annuus]|nr:hypothetical protein HanIR_Chr05g0254981 [Helianthus annuus]